MAQGDGIGWWVTDILPLWGIGYGGAAGRRSQSGRAFGGRGLALNLNLGGALLWTNLNLGWGESIAGRLSTTFLVNGKIELRPPVPAGAKSFF